MKTIKQDSKKRLAIDIDGVVFPFVDAFRENACRFYNVCDLAYPPCYDFRQGWADRKDLTDEILKKTYDSVLYGKEGDRTHKNWQPYPGSQAALEEASRLGYQIYFLTARRDAQGFIGTRQSLRLIARTTKWIKEHFPFAEDSIYSKIKFGYALDFLLLLDDHGRDCQDWIKAGGEALLCKRPFNSDYHKSDIPTFKGWENDNLIDHIRKIEAKQTE